MPLVNHHNIAYVKSSFLFLFGFESVTIQMKTYEKGKYDDILSSLLFWHSVTLFFHMASDVVFFHRLLIFLALFLCQL